MNRLTILAVITLLGLSLTPGYAQAPGYAEIIEPRGGDAISGVYTIRGSASHPSFQSYQLSFALMHDATDTWFLIGEPQMRPVVDAGMGLWDTTRITDGDYLLKLEVVLDNDQTIVAIVEGVRIRNQLPVETSTAAPLAEISTPTPLPPTRTPRPTPLPTREDNGIGLISGAFSTGIILGLITLTGVGLFLGMRRRTKERYAMMQMRRLLRKQGQQRKSDNDHAAF